MKYIVEIKPEYEDSFKGVMILGAKDSNLFVDTLAVEDLEELNSDYINDHFGGLQDDAYQKGYDAGIIANSFVDKSDEAYQRGLDDAWEAAMKVVLCPCDGGTGLQNLVAIFGTNTMELVFINNSASEAIAKLKAYEEQKADDEIKVGDELEHTVSGYTSKAIFLEKIKDDEDWYKCLFWTGCGVTILTYPKRQFKRTGRHFDIDKILEEMAND